MRHMLDTNICIYIIKKSPKHIFEKFKAFSLGDICISSITLAELRYGVEKSQHDKKNRSALEQFIAPLMLLAFDDQAACQYGFIRAYLEKKGTPIGSLDLMIAAHAQSTHSILITHNVKEFLRVPQLKIEDWYN